MLTAQQQLAVDAWRRGRNVRVVAVPGAGKSRVLLEACAVTDAPCLLLAYNRDLCTETRARLVAAGLAHVRCHTFHGLATQCVAPAPDDLALHELLDQLDAGALVAQPVEAVHLLIDEAQDFRPSFLRLLRHLVRPRQVMVVGDPRQMLYDAGADGARPEYLAAPHLHFANEPWETVHLDLTHRLTPPMTALVGALYAPLRSAHASAGAPVEVYTLALARAGPLLRHLLATETVADCRVLAPRRRRNAALCAAVNHLSAHGVRVHVQGVDGHDARLREHKLVVSSWHAAKGTEAPVCVVFGVGADAAPHPLYVALTRATRRLVVLHDAHAPHLDLLSALADATVVTLDAPTRALLASPPPRVLPAATPPCTHPVCTLDDWRAGALLPVASAAAVETPADGDELLVVGDGFEDMGETYLLACELAVEAAATGRMRRLEDMCAPIRHHAPERRRALECGSHARILPPHVADATLLPLRAHAQLAQLRRARSPHAFARVAVLARAWNNYHHSLRQTPDEWMDVERFDRGCARLRAAVDGLSRVRYDARVSRVWHGVLFERRVTAVADELAILCTWSAALTAADRQAATIVAALHPRGRCRLRNLRTDGCLECEIESAETVLEQLHAEWAATHEAPASPAERERAPGR